MNHHMISTMGKSALVTALLFGAVQGASAAPVTIKYLFDNATNTSYDNPGLDSTLNIDPALGNFSAWTDADGTLIQTTPIQATNGLQGQGSTGRAVAARSWHDGNSFNFSFDIAAGSRLSLSQIDFFEQGSSGAQGLGPTSWTLSINGQEVGAGSAFRGNPGAVRTLNAGLPTDLTGTVAFSIFATGSENGSGVAANATWRIDNFTLSGDVAPVPVPGAVWLFGSAIAGLAGLRRRGA
jgi:hypothetical protein